MADLIDRAPMIEPLKAAIQSTNNPMAIAMYNAVLAALERAPTIDAVPVVHARWMHDPHDISTFYAGDCLNCGCAPKRRTMSFKPWNYCPHCGARMDADAPERAGKESGT